MGVKQHIIELGKKAKQELALTNPYVKGTIFSIMIDGTFEMYEQEYFPVNPYSKSEFNKESHYEYFNKGVLLGMDYVEHMDIRLFKVMEEIYLDYELLPKKDFIKVITRLSKGKYDLSKELSKYEKILKEHTDEDELESRRD